MSRALTQSALAGLGISYAYLKHNGEVVESHGPLGVHLKTGSDLGETIPLFIGHETEFSDIANGAQDPIEWPNMALPQLAPGRVFDIRLGSAFDDGSLIVSFLERGDQVAADQEVMQARNTLQIAEKSLRNAREAADLANQSKNRLLLMLREEIREPLANLVTAAQILGDELEGGHAYLTGTATDLEGEGSRLLGLLDSLLDVTEGAAGSLISHDEEYSVSELLTLLRSEGGKQARRDDQLSFIDKFIAADWANVSVAVDPRRFSQLVNTILALVHKDGPLVICGEGPNIRGDFLVIKFGLDKSRVSADLSNCLRNPRDQLLGKGADTGAELMLVAMLLQSTGIIAGFDEARAEIFLSIPILPTRPLEGVRS